MSPSVAPPRARAPIAPSDRGRRADARRSAFTLIEVLIVVVILGIIASMVLGNVSGSVTGTREQTFVRALKGYSGAVQMYHARESSYPTKATAGVIPPEFQSYLQAGAWDLPTPVGGQWDIDRQESQLTMGIGVDFGGTQPPLETMTEIDRIMDDGNLATGRFRRFGTAKFYHVLEE